MKKKKRLKRTLWSSLL